MTGDEADPRVRQAVRALRKASEDFARAYGAWSVDPHRWSELDRAQERLEAARREAALAAKRPDFRQP